MVELLRRLMTIFHRWQPSDEHKQVLQRVNDQERRAEQLVDARRRRLRMEYDAMRRK